MITRLSSPVEDMKNHYEVVVVGSGYGGAITASRLARTGRQVCLLERGKELQPDEYPDTGPEVLNEMQIDFPLNVTFTDHVNHVGVQQKACTLCEDCVSGCNYAAKNTVLMNYLPDARNHGAQIFTRVAVRHVQRRNDRWLVHYQALDTGRECFDAPPLFVSADIVVLAAGALGSTEVLLRSGAHGLPLSERVGQRMTGNGDVLAFSYNSDHEVNGVGWGHRNNVEVGPVGPCITGIIDNRDQSDLDQGMVIEEGSIPGALADYLPRAMHAVARASGIDTDAGLQDQIKELSRELDSLTFGSYRGAVRNTQTYLVMSHDDGNGRAAGRGPAAHPLAARRRATRLPPDQQGAAGRHRSTGRHVPDVANIPITFIHGAENACFLPESTEKTLERLRQRNGSHLYRRHVIPGYGHIDCMFGKRAALDVYPLILEHLEATC